ncbi:cysteine-rich CWC family protein [Shewanella violacea]|uniref:Cysteine-rich CWC protein n=1 Tax=Shewanella violacea (strain JCM 10179 / CIP 106290 / LMG 19151 / DSS12) TaxID=637905 RepID=D4ZCG2_SHEVD|nr:cysteine-rich CWC family protein [Shewanella violacea]BAJ03707.1 conserved hypothetical protein [Shewanella violacea DSS12]
MILTMLVQMTRILDNDSTCPLCQRQNACAVIQAKSISECWCSQVTFPAKEKLRQELLNLTSCICQACIEKLKQEADLGIKRLD